MEMNYVNSGTVVGSVVGDPEFYTLHPSKKIQCRFGLEVQHLTHTGKLHVNVVRLVAFGKSLDIIKSFIETGRWKVGRMIMVTYHVQSWNEQQAIEELDYDLLGNTHVVGSIIDLGISINGDFWASCD